ncbi:MAG: PaaI family thioesterase [Candidatus Freyarchaeota archaeon]
MVVRVGVDEFLSKLSEEIPYYRLLGMRIVEAGDGRATLKMNVEEKHFQPQGAVHGGALASIADAAGAIALFTLANSGELVTTVELKVNFTSPVKGGEVLAKGKVVHRGKTIGVCEVDVVNEGKLAAKALATYLFLKST